MFKMLSIRTLEKPDFSKTGSDDFNHQSARYVSVMRVLQPENEYQFLTGKLADDFFSNDNKINICAIVGENGMGKSSLLELMIRILNNVAFALRFVFDDNLHPRFVKNVYAELKYSIDGIVCVITCNNNTIEFQQNEKKIWTYNYLERKNENHGITIEDIAPNIIVDFDKWAKKWLGEFFYTIVVNYSAYGLNYNDYFPELTDAGELDDGEQDMVDDEETFWAYSIFHKNDEYQLPIVLNPYRSEGNIDYNNEKDLTETRIFMLAMHHEDALQSILNNKKLYSFVFDTRTELNRITNDNFDSLKVRREMQFLGVSQNWRLAKNSEFIRLCKSIIQVWSDCYRIDFGNKRDDQYEKDYYRALNYIVYKTIDIARTYKRYSKYTEALRQEAKNDKDEINRDLTEFIGKLYANNTHITLKLRRTFAWLIFNHYGTVMKPEIRIAEHEMLFSVFIKTIKDIKSKQVAIMEELESSYPKQKPNCFIRHTWEDVELFPAQSFHTRIILEKEMAKTEEEKRVAMDSLSSGEKQIINFLSTIIYQIYNITSRWNDAEEDIDAVKYKYVNVLMDEVELYFHPKYQTRLIDRLINSLNIESIAKNIKGTNIIISTHSPFMLSDIPQQNILYLENGESRKDVIVGETFGANVYDLLNNQFFMNKFIGDFAERKIKAAIAKLNEWKKKQKEKGDKAIEIDPEELNEVRNTIAIIGDRYLKAKMEEKLMRVIAGDNRMKEYRKKVEELKKEYLYDSNKVRFK